MSVISSATLTLTELTADGRRFHFARPIQLEVNDEGAWWMEHTGTEISGYGLTSDEALEMFATMFAYCWDEYACSDEDFHFKRPRELREQLRQLVTRVEPAE